ncbi:putative cytokinetic ring protein SteA [Sediminivirga luteola]|uniref:Thiamin pyrophosphokinase n=1 Tax=Sediminivirga luteola TaxID=1774748 RepID=A0A8J2U0E3_9MICO|nr:putative cytokinetic ring protein SteA [Sediminivirga luteola]MCI2265395.1 putative cytokinetic ring protein SteA [Sediminivirga luteola]GGA24291.1 thiamin pyrophosphokinase [Sediminivirga luteola]
MKLRKARKPGDRNSAIPETSDSLARLDRRTKDLTKRLQPGEIAIIDHEDIDRVSAEALVECRPAAVVNAAKSISGRYPNLGPGILLDGGIPLIDDAGGQLFERITEGDRIRVEGGRVLRGDEEIAAGVLQTRESIDADMATAEAGMDDALVSFVENTIEYVRKDSDLLLGKVGVPHVRTDFTGRQALIVVRGYHYKEDLAMLRPYIREYRPILIGVDGGADAILEAGYQPDMIVGDMDSVSDTALTSGAELVVHAYRDGRAPGVERLHDLGLECVLFPASGTSEDIAMLLADDKGASLIVAVGTHDTLIEFLDKGRKGMASTFLTRLRVGSKLVDAKGVSRLYRQRISSLQLALLVVAGFVALSAAVTATPGGQTLLGLIGANFDGFFQWLRGLFDSTPPTAADLGIVSPLLKDSLTP